MKKTVFMGDSITAGFTLLKAYNNIINIGVGGNKTTESIPLVKTLRLLQPDQVVLMIGINDFLCNVRFFDHGYTIPFYKTFDVLIDLIRTNLPKTKLYLVSILPMYPRLEGQLNNTNVLSYNHDIQNINNFIKQQAKAYQATYLDLYSVFIRDGYLNPEFTVDGIHLSEIGYQKYLEFLKVHTTDIFI